MDYKHDLNSDDDFDCSNGFNDNYGSGNSNGRSSSHHGPSKAELRKTNKPIMEKRRRARINHCLNELKSLILEAMRKDPARHTKLEKADILEMTVKHLQSVQRQQLNMAIQTDPSVIHKFKTGFVECAEEVNRYVAQLDGIDANVRQRLTNHLSNCANSLEQIGSMTNFNNGYRGQLNAAAAAAAANAATLFQNFTSGLPQDLNNNSNSAGNGVGVGVGVGVAPTAAPMQMGGLQLIPSRLPSGEFALIMPNAGGNASAPVQPLMPAAAPFGWQAPIIDNTTPPLAQAQAQAQAPAPGLLPPATNLGMANPNHLNDYAQTFRMSAFSQPQQLATCQPPIESLPTSYHANGTMGGAHQTHHHSTASSPPLSPISSASSRDCDDSLIMQTQPDFVHAEPNPVNNSFAGVFSTPPPTSAETSFNSSTFNSSTSSTHSVNANEYNDVTITTTTAITATNLQQQQVTSTSGQDCASAQPTNNDNYNYNSNNNNYNNNYNNNVATSKRQRDSVPNEPTESNDSSSNDEPHAKKPMSSAIASANCTSAWRPW